MEDRNIIGLYHRRDEQAISETDQKYRPYCHGIAYNLLGVREDAEECVSDTWHAAWNKMPPEWPDSLRAFLGRITRNLSISRFRSSRARKRYNGMEILLSELEECLPSAQSTEETVLAGELTGVLNRWLEEQNEDDVTLFLRRYWYGEKVGAIALSWGVPANRLSQRLYKMRQSLRCCLESEGVSV